MDIRTKLVFALVAVSLGSMLALGAFSHAASRALLQRMALRELEAVAETKKQDLERVIVDALADFRGEVESGAFPAPEHSYTIPDAELESLLGQLRGRGS